MLAFITFLFLLAVTIVYLGKVFAGKNAGLDKINASIAPVSDKLMLVGLAYGIFAAFVTPMTVFVGTDMIIRLSANILLILMCLPQVFDGLVVNYQHKINAAVLEELRHLIDWANRHVKLVTYAALFVEVLLFATLLR